MKMQGHLFENSKFQDSDNRTFNQEWGPSELKACVTAQGALIKPALARSWDESKKKKG